MHHSRDSLSVERLMEKIWTLDKSPEAMETINHPEAAPKLLPTTVALTLPATTVDLTLLLTTVIR